MRHQGFTLIELLLGLIVSGILASLATPSFKGLLESQQRQGVAQSLATGLRYARTEAIARNQPVVIHAREDDWSQGWRILTEHNADIPDEALLIERRLSGQVRIVGNSKVAQRLRFGGLGDLLGAGNGTLFVCLNDRPASHYQVVVAVTGQVRVIEQQVSQAYCG